MGRRLAFDQAKGRLWVICEQCSRWNLSPIDERWEAIEACEKAYHDARKRVATDQIGLAKVNDGLALVRIGRPVFPEYASWRYGERFRSRRTKHLINATLGTVAGIGLFAGGPLLAKAVLGMGGGGGFWFYQVWSGSRNRARLKRVLGNLDLPDGATRVVLGKDAEEAHFSNVAQGELTVFLGSRMATVKREFRERYTGDTARHFLRLALPHVNRKGGTDKTVDEAVSAMQLAQGHDDPVLIARQVLARRGYAHSPLTDIAPTLSLGLEMAVMEDVERRWLETELGLLEVAWKEAEELAGVADDLTLPEWIGKKLDVFKRG